MHRLVCRPVLLCFPLSNLPGPRAIYRWSPLCKNAAEMPVWSTVVPYSCIASEIHAGPGKAWWDGFGRAWACSYGCSRDETLTPCGIPSPISTGCTGGGYFPCWQQRAVFAQGRREGWPLSLLCLLRGFACGPFPSWFILTRSSRSVGVRTFQCRRPFTRRRLRGFPSFGPFSASPREPVAALNRMAMAKQSSAMATRTSPPRSLEGDA